MKGMLHRAELSLVLIRKIVGDSQQSQGKAKKKGAGA